MERLNCGTNSSYFMNISVIGLGKLGTVVAAVLADNGHTVIGVDINPDVVKSINHGVPPVHEPGLDTMLSRNQKRVSATDNIEAAVTRTEITLVVVPTPSEADGTFSLKCVLDVARFIASALARMSRYHLVVISSTVMPRSMENEVLPLMERISGKRCGVEFGLCYNPEFIALGSVIRDMLNPDMILIGESDPRAGAMLEDLYKTVCANQPVVARMNFINAELAKLSLNIFVTAKISYANMLAEVCEHLPGADVDTVCAAVGLDSRIGKKYLKGAFGYGGPCFPRDNKAFAAFSDRLSVDATLAKATDEINNRQVDRVARKILQWVSPQATVGILGMSYKPDTDVIVESQGLMLAQYLLNSGLRVAVYDPAAMPAVRQTLKGPVLFSSSMEECAAESTLLVIATPWNEFKRLQPKHLRTGPPRPVIVDWWRILRPEDFQEADYVGCGLGDTQSVLQGEPS
jgi:UDPglucose 6-dehydrogenase